MNTLQAISLLTRNIPERTLIPVDLVVVCLWSALGVLLTAVFLALGFGAEFAQDLVPAV